MTAVGSTKTLSASTFPKLPELIRPGLDETIPAFLGNVSAGRAGLGKSWSGTATIWSVSTG